MWIYVAVQRISSLNQAMFCRALTMRTQLEMGVDRSEPQIWIIYAVKKKPEQHRSQTHQELVSSDRLTMLY